MGFLFADKAQHIYGLEIKSIHQPAPFNKTKNPLKNKKTKNEENNNVGVEPTTF
jgi:hypothetical protein